MSERNPSKAKTKVVKKSFWCPYCATDSKGDRCEHCGYSEAEHQGYLDDRNKDGEKSAADWDELRQLLK